MYNSTHEFEVAILVNGRPIPEVHHHGRTYVEGRKNSEYSLQIRNNTHRRILVIPAVDGLNVLDGQDCGLESPGYVIEAYQTEESPGWKVAGAQEAGRFVFKPQGARYEEDETYAESMGLNPTNQGTIGFMVFHEKATLRYPPPFDPWKSPPLRPLRIKAARAKAAFDGTGTKSSSGHTYGTSLDSLNISSSVADNESRGFTADANCVGQIEDENSLGTGWGEAVEFHTQDVAFERATPSQPDAVFVFYYDTIRNLKRIGVPVEQLTHGHSSTPYEANPFPASPHVSGGCKPPPGWRRKKRRGRS